MNRLKDKVQEPFREEAAKSLLKGDTYQMVLEKMMFQWKTVRKAFMDLNTEKDGTITREELKYQFDFWGLDITP